MINTISKSPKLYMGKLEKPLAKFQPGKSPVFTALPTLDKSIESHEASVRENISKDKNSTNER